MSEQAGEQSGRPMKSSEVASIAGVSVRALRHYHALGILPEPPRGPNGYRCYSALDVARVLRIKRLASLGFSLADIGVMAEGCETDDAPAHGSPSEGGLAESRSASGASASFVDEQDALEQLDRELAMQIERLQEQRRIVAQLHEEALDPALPPRFARVVKRLFEGTASRMADLGAYDRAALDIAAHAYREEDVDELERFVDKVEHLGLFGVLAEVEARIDGLDADASEQERAALVALSLELLEPLVECFDPANWQEGPDETSTQLISVLSDVVLNEAQADVSRRIQTAISELVLAKSAE